MPYYPILWKNILKHQIIKLFSNEMVGTDFYNQSNILWLENIWWWVNELMVIEINRTDLMIIKPLYIVMIILKLLLIVI